ncbi:MAG: terpene cyclase/mutase family protein [Planctomycetes bacterium]|nr:terpene cyclase/mutase family protein [Planctomycetota bacterium]
MATQEGLIEQAETSYLDTEAPPEESLSAAASVPWVAVALAVHAILLMVAWFILPAAPAKVYTSVLEAQVKDITPPPPPVNPPEKQVEWPDDSPVNEEPVEDKRVQTEDADHAEDPSDSPNRDLAQNPNENPSDNESNHPNKDSSTSAVGLGGGIGGGGGPGGEGGMIKRRPHPDGGVHSPATIEDALVWLKDHQNREGNWSATTFGEDSTRTGARHTYNIEFNDIGKAGGDTGWEATCDVGLTGLSMLAFTGAGYDHRTGAYKNTVRNAAIYLRKVQDNDGCFGSKEDDQFVYNHAIATMAMAEIYGLSGDAIFKPIVERAVDFILKAQNPGLGWRYGVQPLVNDTSVTGWMVLTLHTCELAGLHFDASKCYSDAEAWFDMVTVDVNGYPKTGYDSPGSNNSRLRSASGVYDNNPSMDAICVMSQLFMGKRDLQDKQMKALVKACIEKDYLPRWELGKIDYYYWYYASLALFQMGGSMWDQWEKAMVKTLLDHQRGFCEADKAAGLTSKEALDEHGSWDPVDAWGSAGGRVYATAINALTLETYYRHERMNGHSRD